HDRWCIGSDHDRRRIVIRQAIDRASHHRKQRGTILAAIGKVGTVGEVEQVLTRKTIGDLARNGVAADPGIKHRNRLLQHHCAPEPPCTIFSFSFWSTISTVRSMSALGAPSWCEISFTSRSTRSMKGAPAATARAADDGFSRLSAALAYFANGT